MACWFASPAAQAACDAESGPRTTALLELYVSGRCPECPAAERWLADLRSRYPELIAVAIALGSSSYAGARLSPRQRLALLHRPHFLLQGSEVAPGELEASIARVNARPAGARLRLEVRGSGVVIIAQASDAELYLGADEGTRVIDWMGPLAVRGRLVERRSRAPKSGVVAFLHDRRTRVVLQALRLSAC